MRKPGVEIKMTSERLVFFGIVVTVVLFIIMMPTIYNMMEKLDGDGKINYGTNNNVDEEETDEAIDVSGETTATCSLSVSETNGETTESVTLYYTDNKLTSYKVKRVYAANTEEYQNFVFSELVVFNNLKLKNKDLAGLSIITTSEAMRLTAEMTFDLTKLDVTKVSEELKSYLTVTNGQSKVDAEKTYLGKGYTCK